MFQLALDLCSGWIELRSADWRHAFGRLRAMSAALAARLRAARAMSADWRHAFGRLDIYPAGRRHDQPAPVGGTTTTPPVGGSTAVTTCTLRPKSTGGLPCPGGKCTVGAYSGYDFGFSDGLGSTYCVDANSLCAAGTTLAPDPPAYTIWGAGFGFSLSPLTTLTNTTPVQLTGSGVSVTLSSLPTGGATARVQVTVGITQYCALMTSASQTIPWASFNTECWQRPAARRSRCTQCNEHPDRGQCRRDGWCVRFLRDRPVVPVGSSATGEEPLAPRCCTHARALRGTFA